LPLALVSTISASPALRLRRVARFEIHLGVDPSHDGEIALAVVGEPKRVVGVLREVEVVGAEAGVDVMVFLGLGIKDRDLARVLHKPVGRAGERIELRRAQL